MTPRVLTVAGSDSSGGAGIQQDLKTFVALGVWGLSAVTSVTAQDRRGVRARYDLPPHVVVAQIEAATGEGGIDAVKTGMLGGGEDYELLIALAPEDVEPLRVAIAPTPLSAIGRFTAGAESALEMIDGTSRPLAAFGWDHFR